MFVIIRGSVEVTTVKKFMGKNIKCALKSLYDGSTFGESAEFKLDKELKDIA